MFCPPTAPNRTDKIAAHGACFPIVCAQRRPVQTRTTDTVLNRDQARPPPSAPFPHRHLQAPRGFLLGRFPNAGRCHARRSRPPRPASENLHQIRPSCLALVTKQTFFGVVNRTSCRCTNSTRRLAFFVMMWPASEPDSSRPAPLNLPDGLRAGGRHKGRTARRHGRSGHTLSGATQLFGTGLLGHRAAISDR